ncbi:hypothetical protein Pmani_013536 [Petrolisthes manimaculis]|uniref:FAM192A/Fyv6 N-terminal domain-containing protein n=1 Tax=Petrolisthes manimaculis TaxID=1843537 RepID=A0AAE1UDJ1_9EUCA|nr:hypothetical protein Pmani_013536 [Petrolisthes manimaculis]
MSSGFITEKEVAERRRLRQENWDKTRGEEDPEDVPEAPEAIPDHRSLYEKLQEQQQKKQEEYDEAHKFKNMVRGLEDDEVDFLELVDRTKLQQEIKVRTEESSAIAEYRKKVSEMRKNQAEEELRAEVKAGEMRKAAGTKKTPSHLSLLAGAIKRKSSEDNDPSRTKRTKPESGSAENNEAGGSSLGVEVAQSTATSDSPITSAPPVTSAQKTGFQCIAVLPGLGVYTDSSDSENNGDTDSDSEDDTHRRLPTSAAQPPRDITGRIVKPVTQCGGAAQGGC